MIPFGSGWLVRNESAYVDDYSADQLATFPALVLVGYRYHDRSKAFGLLNDYVRAGGSLYIETGWQYVDPDWDLGSPAPSVLPVSEVRWGALDPKARVVVSGKSEPAWGSMTYGGAGSGWGASSAALSSIRPGAETLVSIGGRVVVARKQLGRGRVVWSGMNLIAHAAGAGSPTEDQFTAEEFRWLLRAGDVPAQQEAVVTWVADDQARLALSSSSGTTWVLFKESFAPGWSARLVTPRGSSNVELVPGEADFMLARLDSVPAGSTLVFTYGPTAFEQAAWVLSLATLAGLIAWLLRPALIERPLRVVFSGVVRRLSPRGADPHRVIRRAPPPRPRRPGL